MLCSLVCSVDATARRGGPDVDSGLGYKQFIDYNIEAQSLGYHSSFLVEHHFTGAGQVSASLSLLTWLAAKTRTLRLGTAVLVLPWHNPVLLAEQAATIDLLSGGRLDFGVGKGYRHNEFQGFCVPIEEADARFNECLDVVIKSWTSKERFSHTGKHWNFTNIIIEPPTAQKPHPPMWMAAGSPNSIRQVAERRYNLLLDQFASPEAIGDGSRCSSARSRSAAALSIRLTLLWHAHSMLPRTRPTKRLHLKGASPRSAISPRCRKHLMELKARRASWLFQTHVKRAKKPRAIWYARRHSA